MHAGSDRFGNRSSPSREGSKEKVSAASSNLAKLKDMYGDLGEQKGEAGTERAPIRDSGGEEVIRLGAATWK